MKHIVGKSSDGCQIYKLYKIYLRPNQALPAKIQRGRQARLVQKNESREA